MAMVWIVIERADADAEADGVEDEMFTVVYRQLKKAQKECSAALRQIWGEDLGGNDKIDWSETTAKGDKGRRLIGRPQADVEGTFEVFQVEIV